jgi:hypothetical protein
MDYVLQQQQQQKDNGTMFKSVLMTRSAVAEVTLVERMT